jgi:hypothetical protein
MSVHSYKFSCEINDQCFHSWQLCGKSIKSYTKAKKCNFYVNILILFVILLILIENSLLKQQSTQLPAIKAVILQENFKLCVLNDFSIVYMYNFWVVLSLFLNSRRFF